MSTLDLVDACKRSRALADIFDEKATVLRLVPGTACSIGAKTTADLGELMRKAAEAFEAVEELRLEERRLGFRAALGLPLGKLLRVWLLQRLAR